MEKRLISIDNGLHFATAAEAMPEINKYNLWDAVVNAMDDETRESVSYDMAPCSELEFLDEYLLRAENDLVIG